MIREETLVRSSNKIAAYIENYVTTAGTENRDEILALFENIHTLFPHWVISTCPMLHPDIHFVSPNGPEVLGYNKQFLIDNSRMEKFFHLVHPADVEKLYDCVLFMHDYLESVPPEEHNTYRTVLHYRFRKPGGQYIYMHDEKAILNLRGTGNLYYTLFRDITAEKPFTGVKAELFRQQGQQLDKIREHNPSAERKPLSKREEELVTLIRQGLSTKEIAGHLNISPHTARNIKSKLFEKFNVNNSIELLNMTA